MTIMFCYNVFSLSLSLSLFFFFFFFFFPNLPFTYLSSPPQPKPLPPAPAPPSTRRCCASATLRGAPDPRTPPSGSTPAPLPASTPLSIGDMP